MGADMSEHPYSMYGGALIRSLDGRLSSFTKSLCQSNETLPWQFSSDTNYFLDDSNLVYGCMLCFFPLRSEILDCSDIHIPISLKPQTNGGARQTRLGIGMVTMRQRDL